MYIQGVLGALYQRLKSAKKLFQKGESPPLQIYIYICIYSDAFGSIDAETGTVSLKNCDMYFVSSQPVKMLLEF